MSNKVQCFAVCSGRSKNELQHWKYIKKKKLPNGKWRYYYDVKDMMGYDEKERFEKADKAYEKAAKDWQKKADEAARFNNFAVNSAGYDPNTGEYRLSKDMIEERDKLYKIADEYMKDLDRAGKKASDAAIAYNKTPLAKLENLKSNIDRGSSWLKKKLGIH